MAKWHNPEITKGSGTNGDKRDTFLFRCWSPMAWGALLDVWIVRAGREVVPWHLRLIDQDRPTLKVFLDGELANDDETTSTFQRVPIKP